MPSQEPLISKPDDELLQEAITRLKAAAIEYGVGDEVGAAIAYLVLVERQRMTDDIQPYDSDHTALVHVLWDAQREGMTIRDADALAEHIMASKWMQAVEAHAKAQP
jgi:hypothetical protein